MNNKQFLSSSGVKDYIRDTRPDVKDIRVINHGFHNIIAIADKNLVFRFPRNDLSARRLDFEASLLKILEGKLELPIPRVIEEHHNPDYHVTSLVAGKHLSSNELSNFDASQAEVFGTQLAKFIINLNSVIKPELITQLRRQSGLDRHSDELWPEYLKRTLAFASFKDKPWLEELAHSQFKKWEATVESSKLHQIAIHDDLHPGNLLFIDDKMSGMLDFGYAKSGTAAQELRLLPCINKRVLLITIEKYAEFGGPKVDIDEVETWALSAQLASYCDRLSKDQTDHPSFIRSRRILRQLVEKYSDLF